MAGLWFGGWGWGLGSGVCRVGFRVEGLRARSLHERIMPCSGFGVGGLWVGVWDLCGVAVLGSGVRGSGSGVEVWCVWIMV